MKNYDFNFFITDHFTNKGKGKNFTNFSIQPYIYREDVNEYLKKMKKTGRDSDFEFYFHKTGNFYSNLILNFFKNIFHKTLSVTANSNDSNLIENIYQDFRKEVLIKFKQFSKLDNSLNLQKLRHVLNDIVAESIFLKEIVSYYEFFGNKSSDKSDSDFTEDSNAKSKEATLCLKIMSTQEALLRNKFNITSFKGEKESTKNQNLTMVYSRRF